MPDLIPFHYHDYAITVHVDADQEPWWEAKEVCPHLGLTNVSRACSRLDDDEKRVITSSDVTGRAQEILMVNEAGLYALILSSRKPAARAFKRWVTHDVLPALRKAGRYEVPQVKDPAIQMLIEMAVRLDEARQIADDAKQQAQQAQDAAIQALHGQQWLTIQQYVAIYRLDRQLPPALQAPYGKWLTGYCLEKGLPVYQHRSIKGWEEHTYPIWSIQTTLDTWLARRHGQSPLALVHSHQE